MNPRPTVQQRHDRATIATIVVRLRGAVLCLLAVVAPGCSEDIGLQTSAQDGGADDAAPPGDGGPDDGSPGDGSADDGSPGDGSADDGGPGDASGSAILSLVESITVDGASIWGVVSNDGEAIHLTTMAGGTMQLRRYTTDLEPIGSNVSIASQADVPPGHNIADHKHVYWNDLLYVTFCTGSADRLYLFRTDVDGVRQGDLVTVVEDSPIVTNDMLLVTDGALLYVVIVDGDPQKPKRVFTYNEQLTAVGGPIDLVASPRWSPLGSAYHQGSAFFVFSGNFDNHTLVATIFPSWTSVAPEQHDLIGAAGEWHYFSSGSIFDAANQRWYVSFSHFYDPGPADTTQTLDLAAFDSDLSLLEHQVVTPLTGYQRGHLTILNGALFLSYDGGGHVFLERYHITPAP